MKNKITKYKNHMNIIPGSYIYIHGEEAFEISCRLLQIPKEKLHTHPDVHIIKGKGSIGIDSIREAGRYLRIKPVIASHRLLFIENFHLATEEAQNAFLKTFEEPPPYAYVLLVTPYIDRLLKTIVSRAQVMSGMPNSEMQASKVNQNLAQEIQKVIQMNIAERLLWLDEKLKDLEDKDEARRVLLSLVDQLLFEAIELVKRDKLSEEVIDVLKEARWKIEQGFVNPKLLVEGTLLALREHTPH